MILDAKETAQRDVQNFLDQLECWMGNWRLSLAPKKCSQITFSKAKNNKNDEMNIKLYDEIIKSEIKDEPCEDVQEYRKDETCSFFFKQEDVKLENVFVKSEWDPFYPVKQESCTVFIKEEEEEEEEGNLQSNFFFFTY